jgi:DNA modification methylase
MIEPHYTDSATTLYHGDALAILPTLPDASVDCILSDPPYGCTQNAWDTVVSLPDMWREFKRIAKPGANIVLTCDMRFAVQLIESNRKAFRYDLVWEKSNPSGHLNANLYPLRAHEFILIFGASDALYSPQMVPLSEPATIWRNGRLGSSSSYGSQKPTEARTTNERHPRSVLRFATVGTTDPERAHPTQKPLDLFQWLTLTYTNPGDVILDPFAGSGTTLLAAKLTGRKSIGVEKELPYCEIIKRRLQQECLQFDEAHPTR